MNRVIAMHETEFLKPLRGFIKAKTANSTVITEDKLETICRGALDEAKKKYNSKYKMPFYDFLKKKAEEIIHGELAITAQQGNQQAYWELFVLIDSPLTNFIRYRMSCSIEDASNYAEQTWRRWIEAKKYKISLYDNKKMEQSFYQYLKNKARTIINHRFKEIECYPNDNENGINIWDRLGHGDTPEAQLEAKEEVIKRNREDQNDFLEYKKAIFATPEIILELFLLALLCETNKPHQTLAFGFRLMHWKPLKMIKDLSNSVLEDMGGRLCEDLYVFIGKFLDWENYKNNYFFHLERQFSVFVNVMYPETEYKQIRKTYKNCKTGLIYFNSFYGKNKSASIAHWIYRVKQRTRNSMINEIINKGS